MAGLSHAVRDWGKLVWADTANVKPGELFGLVAPPELGNNECPAAPRINLARLRQRFLTPETAAYWMFEYTAESAYLVNCP